MPVFSHSNGLFYLGRGLLIAGQTFIHRLHTARLRLLELRRTFIQARSLERADPVSYTHLDVYKRQGLERVGAAVVPASSGNSEKQLMLMKDFGVTTLIATPTYAMYRGELAAELGYGPEDFKLRIGLFGSEGLSLIHILS